MSKFSLRWRLLIVWAIFIALTLQIAGVGLRVLFERSITRKTQTELEADLRQLRRGMEVGPDGMVRVVRRPTDPQFDIVFGGRYWQVDEGAQTLLRSPSLGNSTLSLPSAQGAANDAGQTWLVGPEAQKLYAVVRNHVLSSPDNGSRRTVRIVTAVDAAEIEQDTNKFASDLFSSLMWLALLLLLGAWAHGAVVLRPLKSLRDKVAAVRKGEVHRLDGDYPDEVMPLVTETNALLEAQEKTIQAARERAGDLAHGLKTPLAIMAANARTLRREGQNGMADEIDRQIEAMRGHVERELARVRARGTSGAGRVRVDVALLARRMIDAFQSMPGGEHLSWSAEIPPALMVAMDGDDFNNVLGNLVENAQKFAKSALNVALRRDGTSLEIRVEDDGPGVPEDQLERILRRGERLDTSVSGTGLGLAIVSDLVDLYGGEFKLSRGALSGLHALVVIPLAPD